MKYDVIIVGGGPAGLMTSCFLKEENKELKVLVVEKDKYPYQHSQGGFLNPQALEKFPILEKQRENLIDSAPSSLEFISPDFSKSQIYESDQPVTYLVDRSHFDNGLVEMAKERGVEFSFGRAVKTVSAGTDGAEVILRTRKKLKSRAIVGADGVRGLVASQMGICESLGHFPLYHGLSLPWQRREKAPEKRTPIISLCFGGHPGFAFCWPLQDLIHVGLFLLDRKKVDSTFALWREKLVERGVLPAGALEEKPIKTQSPAGVALLMDRSYEKRTLLVGGAGGFVTNTTAEYLYPGICSANIASQVLLEGFENDNLDELIPTYSRRWNLEFGEYIRGSIQLHANLNFLIDMIFADPRICARYARGFLWGDRVI